MLLGGIYGNQLAVKHAELQYDAALKTCTGGRLFGMEGSTTNCDKEAFDSYRYQIQQNRWPNILIYGLLPLPFLWLIGCIVYFTLKWIGKGF